MAVAFLPDLLAHLPAPVVLEIGGRQVTPLPWQAPAHWRRTSVDVRPGPGVDRVADAHDLRGVFADASFDAAYSHAVFEHLAMPWQVVLELNRVLRPGGVAWIVTHEAFPVHEWPSDFWRFGPGSWEALFHDATGFELLGSRPLQPASVHPDFDAGASFAGHLGCEVQVVKRREADPALRWQVSARALLGGRVYPGKLAKALARGRRGLSRVTNRLGLRPRVQRSVDDPWALGQGPKFLVLAGARARPFVGEQLTYSGTLATSLAPLADASLTHLALLDVLQRESHPWAALAHARRVLAPGGTLYLDSCQVAPAHEPGWRLSSATLPLLLHEASGFRLERSAMLDSCHMLGPGLTGREIQRCWLRTLGLARATGPWRHDLLHWGS